jgi:hypothetical protein
MSDAVSRDLPIPASPQSNATWPSPVFAFDQRRSKSQVPPHDQQARSIRWRAEPQTGFQLRLAGVQQKPVLISRNDLALVQQ